jgi:hypothetical protein
MSTAIGKPGWMASFSALAPTSCGRGDQFNAQQGYPGTRLNLGDPALVTSAIVDVVRSARSGTPLAELDVATSGRQEFRDEMPTIDVNSRRRGAMRLVAV